MRRYVRLNAGYGAKCLGFSVEGLGSTVYILRFSDGGFRASKGKSKNRNKGGNIWKLGLTAVCRRI